MFTIFINDKVITDVGMILEIGPCYGNVIEFISMLIAGNIQIISISYLIFCARLLTPTFSVNQD
jgi:hypothetical protein